MAKRCPACGYGPIGPFIDNCPICAEPVRNVRSGRGYYRGGGSAPWVRWVAGAAIGLVVAVGGCCGLSIWQMGRGFQNLQKEMERAKAEREAERRARTVVVTAADLIREFQDNPAAADRKYKGKYLEVTGVVERTGQDRNTISFVVLHGGDEKTPIKIECFFDDYMTGVPDQGRIGRLDKGQTITVRGEYTGQVSNVQIHEGSLAPEPARGGGGGP